MIKTALTNTITMPCSTIQKLYAAGSCLIYWAEQATHVNAVNLIQRPFTAFPGLSPSSCLFSKIITHCNQWWTQINSDNVDMCSLCEVDQKSVLSSLVTAKPLFHYYLLRLPQLDLDQLVFHYNPVLPNMYSCQLINNHW